MGLSNVKQQCGSFTNNRVVSWLAGITLCAALSGSFPRVFLFRISDFYIKSLLQGQSMSRRMETRKQSRRAASKEALKQMQLLSAIDDEDSTETYEIPSDDDVRTVFIKIVNVL